MEFDLFGYAAAAMGHPHFRIPVFSHTDDGSLYVQNIGEGGVIEEFRPIAHEEVKKLRIENMDGHEGSLEVGSHGHYAFFLHPSEGIFSDRPAVEDYIEANMDFISRSATANLQALRFIGCSISEEQAAIDRISLIFKNAEVRDRFVAIEKALIRAGEEDEKIDKLIDRLHASPNFASTHDIISALNRYKTEFQPRHFKMAMRAFLNNTQVYWISGDDDVQGFARFLIDTGNLRLSEQSESKLKG
ncbi:hypothetical protein [Poseidonocella sp. HB161398]|uniref:hypothetical protein n=1 Tax=Poseidonocella sp. HB161398 TaxID=2320855 RepID=UPI0011089E44|nr:hypothetical protein [Poseidonocella sp. HB161398]